MGISLKNVTLAIGQWAYGMKQRECDIGGRAMGMGNEAVRNVTLGKGLCARRLTEAMGNVILWMGQQAVRM